ncbi:MAG: MFS transporter [Alphaproteobacteria bacterium]|nr:MFS transporter [Alphaproteobacteria bacterium]
MPVSTFLKWGWILATVVDVSGQTRRWVLGLISAGHFFSHFVMLALPPLFLLVKPELDVSWTALGAVVSAFAATTAIGQIPAGILVDRYGARLILIGGMGVMSICLLLAGFTSGYWELFFLFGIAGIGNSVFHPADFSILAAKLDDSIFGRAVSIHSFMGYLGWAGASLVMLPLAHLTDWRTALSIVGIVGTIVTVVMLSRSSYLDDGKGVTNIPVGGKSANLSIRDNLAVMFSLPLVMMSLFYLLTAMATAGIMSFSIVANVTLYDVEKDFAGGILTAHLVALSGGVLIGGWLADQTERHNLVASIGVLAMAGAVLALAFGGGLLVVMVAGMLLSGLFYGISSPSRDLLTRKSAPEGSAGVAFGFTSTGMSIGNFIGPILFGWIMDLDQPQLYYILLAIAIAVSVITVVFTRQRSVSSA